MATELTPATILNIGKLAQCYAVNGVSFANNFNGNSQISQNIAKLIYCVRIGIQIRYDQNPNDPALVPTSNYLFSLLGIYGMQAQARLAALTVAPPIISGPSNQTVNVGQNANFSVTVSSSVPYTLQWYDSNNNPIAGAINSTYTLSNAQLTDTGKTFYVKATNSAATVSSTVAILVVQAQIQAFAYFSSIDPYPALSGGTDNLTYQITQNITHNQPFTITWPSAAANNQFEVIKVPITENVKTIWFNTVLNQGVIPDSVFRATITIGSFYYIISRNAMSLDGGTLTETFS